jgi:uncharacterized protein
VTVPVLLLVASIALLFAAPLLARALLSRPALAEGLDGFVVVSVAGVVMVHVLPESAERAGAAALAVFLLGLVLPVLLHRLERAHTAQRARSFITTAVLAIGMFAHALLDGEALGYGEPELALAVLLHRVPAGLAFWLVMRPSAGAPRTLFVMGVYALGTIVGAVFDPFEMGQAGRTAATSLALFQAFVAGSVLHVVMEAPAHGDGSRGSRALGVSGALLGCALLWVVAGGAFDGHAHGHDAIAGELGAGDAARALAGALAPAYLVGVLATGLVAALVPRSAAGLVGAPAHVVPALFVTLAAFPPAVFLARLVAMSALAIGGRAAVGQLLADDVVDTRTRAARFMAGARAAIDHTAPWMLVGVLAASLVEPALPRDALAMPVLVAVLLCAAVAFPLYVCAAGLTPLAALLVHKGLPLSAALTLLLVGPSISLAALAHIQRAHGRGAALRVVAVLVLVTGASAAALHMLGLRANLSLHERWLMPTLDVIALIVVVILLLSSLFRQGVRAFVEQVLTPAHALEAAHVHGPGCAHEHRPLAPLADRGRKDAPRVMLSFDPRKNP